MAPTQASGAFPDQTTEVPLETASLRKALSEFLDQPVADPITGRQVKLGNYRFGAYAFYDYDDEPIYVGQTSESLRTRIRRHLTNQRTDAVAMSVLDPYEVLEIEVWPLPQFEGRDKKDAQAVEHLSALEATVYEKAVRESRFHAVLNEKPPVSAERVPLPASYRGRIVADEVYRLRAHPDVRLARRAATLSRLAHVVSERRVQRGLRQTLLTQARRLEWLAARRLKAPPVQDPESDDSD